MNGNTSLFSLDDIRNRKQLVLTTLKACIIEGGEISIQIFVKMTRLIPSNLTFPDHAHLLCSEPSTTFIQVLRKYHFTYVDSTTLPSSPTSAPTADAASPNHLANLLTSPLSTDILIRCFSPLPIDSLIRGVFFSLEHGEKYRCICIRYSRALEKYQQLGQEKEASFLRKLWNGGNFQDESYYLQHEELVMERILTHYSSMAMEALDNGAFVEFGRWLLCLQSLLISPSFSSDEDIAFQQRRKSTQKQKSQKQKQIVSLYDSSSHCLKQIASLSGQSLGKLHSVQQMILSFLSCIQLFMNSYLENCFYFRQEFLRKKDSKVRSSQNSSSTFSSSTSIGQTEISIASIGRRDIFNQYEIICQSLIEIKMVIYSLARDRDAYHSSEIFPILSEFVRLIDQLFHDTNTFQSILPTSYRLTHSSNPTNIPLDMMKSLRIVMKPLTQISFGLQFLIGSLGGDVLLELLQMDLDSKYNYNTSTLHGVKLMSQVITQTGDEISISSPPLIFTELLGPFPALLSSFLISIGYCQARIAGKPSEGRQHMYTSYRPGAITRSLLDRNALGYGEREEDIHETKFFK